MYDTPPENHVEFLKPDENMTAIDKEMWVNEENLHRKLGFLMEKAGISPGE